MNTENTGDIWAKHQTLGTITDLSKLQKKGPALHTNAFPMLTSDTTTSVALEYEPPCFGNHLHLSLGLHKGQRSHNTQPSQSRNIHTGVYFQLFFMFNIFTVKKMGFTCFSNLFLNIQPTKKQFSLHRWSTFYFLKWGFPQRLSLNQTQIRNNNFSLALGVVFPLMERECDWRLGQQRIFSP